MILTMKITMKGKLGLLGERGGMLSFCNLQCLFLLLASGLAVQNPENRPNAPSGDLVRELLRKAEE